MKQDSKSDKEMTKLITKNLGRLTVYDTGDIVELPTYLPPSHICLVTERYNEMIGALMVYVQRHTPNSEIINPHIWKDLKKIIVLKPEDTTKTEGKVFIIEDLMTAHRGAISKLELALEYTFTIRRHLGCQFILFAPYSEKDKFTFGRMSKRIKMQVDEVRPLPFDDMTGDEFHSCLEEARKRVDDRENAKRDYGIKSTLGKTNSRGDGHE